jgi:hypothetical protein
VRLRLRRSCSCLSTLSSRRINRANRHSYTSAGMCATLHCSHLCCKVPYCESGRGIRLTHPFSMLNLNDSCVPVFSYRYYSQQLSLQKERNKESLHDYTHLHTFPHTYFYSPHLSFSFTLSSPLSLSLPPLLSLSPRLIAACQAQLAGFAERLDDAKVRL